jgi:NADH-quinone oxidoreductase subunit C
MFQTLAKTEAENLLHEKFGEKIISIETLYDVTVITITHDIIKNVFSFLREGGFTFLTSCNAMHFPDAAQKFGMVYHLHDLKSNFRIRIKSFTQHDPPHFPTLTDLYPAANWMEREAYDFFGFRFDGHPNLKRILNEDSLEGWPLRKEFPLEDQARYDKDDKMFGR